MKGDIAELLHILRIRVIIIREHLQAFRNSVTLAEDLGHYLDDENRSFPIERKKQTGHAERKK